ncbi:uncharacterized protein Z520_05586 [Fonsecaea multimorphosa CBS 102226]|uniref:Uncharacterized protein n=1 Tax=Fonsecaea multimorphosa CBS 102226 TaxID=1442371 RepID=A0A0D2H8U4_9EURO|nr:uncharacterized protein Z520_05586 [Fonsecaea multimorphosa CBS 102226]KIX98285.1 hypothetical protein Z520_05586 [Fonsecaea multimorphosa CBS 102226]OAL24935.1 hypothetical protein AYO22_05271 [Fonsecaea multimorphosa]
MEPFEAGTPRDDVSSIVSFELVDTAPTAKDVSTASTIAVSESDADQESPYPLSTSFDPTTRTKLREWRDILRLYLSYGRAVLTDTWWPELLALTFSFSCLVEIIMTLKYFNGFPLSQLPWGLTLNTILSGLAAASKSSLVFAVAGTMSQCKWCWLKSGPARRRRLAHLQDVDEASRGPLGSLILLLGNTMASLCYIGAIIIILGLVYEPFIQQIVSFPVQQTNVTSSDATVDQVIALDSQSFSESLRGFAVGGIYGNPFVDRAPSCSTGNCTWEPFWSVGWCAKCEQMQLRSQLCNFTPQQIVTQGANLTKTCDFYFPEGYALQATFDATTGVGSECSADDQFSMSLNYTPIWPLSAGEYNQTNVPVITGYFSSSSEFLGEINPLLALGYVEPLASKADNKTSLPETMSQAGQAAPATMCILTPCARRYNVSVVNGSTINQILEVNYGSITTDEAESGYLCWQPHTTGVLDDISPDATTSVSLQALSFCFIQQWIQDILSLLHGVFSATWAPHSETCFYPTSGTGNFILDDVLLQQHSDPTVFIPNIAKALTYLSSQNTTDLTGRPLSGTIFTDKTFVAVRWIWLSLPLGLNVLGLVFLLVTAIYTRRNKVPLWKSSAFALLYHGLEAGLLDDEKVYETTSDMEKAASTTEVSLRSDGLGRKRLLLRSDD